MASGLLYDNSTPESWSSLSLPVSSSPITSILCFLFIILSMVCPRCRSTNIKNTNDSMVCRQCGYTKKGIQTTEQFTGLTKNKKRVNFVTEKNTEVEESKELESLNQRMLRALQHYQTTLFKATKSFVEGAQANHEIVKKVKQVWMKYMEEWTKRQIPLPASFSIKINNKRSYYHQKQQSELSDSSDQDIILQKHQLIQKHQPPEILVKQPEKSLKTQARCLIRKYQPGSERQFFSQMVALKDWDRETLKYAMNAYCKRTYNGAEPIRNRVLSMSQLSMLAQQRNKIITKVDSINKLTKYIWTFDLLTHTLEQKSSYPIEILIAMHQMNKNMPTLTRLTIAQYTQKKTKNKTKKIMPFLDFGLIYSFIHVGTMLAKQPYFIEDIMHHTLIDTQPSQWIDSKAIEINIRPAAKNIRRSSIRICQFTNIKPERMYQLWIGKMVTTMGIAPYTRHISILYRTLIEDTKWLCQQDIIVIAVICIFVKMLVGMDNQPHLAFIHNVDDPKIQSTKKKAREILRNRVNFSYLEIVERLRGAGKGYQQHYKNMENIGIQEISQFLQKIELHDQENERSMIKNVLSSLEVKEMKKMRIDILDDRVKEEKEMKLRKVVMNQIPWKLKKTSVDDKNFYKRAVDSLTPIDIVLPCDNYQIISDLKSVYRCLPRDELFYFLENVSRGRCQPDVLISMIQKLEARLVTYETI